MCGAKDVKSVLFEVSASRAEPDRKDLEGMQRTRRKDMYIK